MREFFQNVPVLGDLFLEHEFYNYDEPILFTCVDKRGTRYLCSCCYLSSQWVLGEMTPRLLIAMIENNITLRETFQKSTACYFLQRTKNGYSNTGDIPSDAFPVAGEYLDLESEITDTFYNELEIENKFVGMKVHSNYPSPEIFEFSNDSNISISEVKEFDVEGDPLCISNVPVTHQYLLNFHSSWLSNSTSETIPSVDFTDIPVYNSKSNANPVAA